MEERMYTVHEVAERLKANPETVRRWIRTGRIKGVMPGGQKLGYRILESELERLLRGETPEGKAAA
jgi:excisionase family DNA binding protein